MPNQQLPNQLPQQEEDDNWFTDMLAAPFRGVEGAVQGVYNLADFVTFDSLPDWDTRFLGRSKTMAGGLVEGVFQFGAGFGPIFGALGKAGMAAKGGSLTQKALAGGNIRKGVIAGGLTDFSVFNGQEERLSNLIRSVPELQNPITEYLAHDADEGELEGRLKNVLEGLGMEAVFGMLFTSIKAMRAGHKAKADTNDPDATYAAIREILGDMASVHGARGPELLDVFDVGSNSNLQSSLRKAYDGEVETDLGYPVGHPQLKQMQQMDEDALALFDETIADLSQGYKVTSWKRGRQLSVEPKWIAEEITEKLYLGKPNGKPVGRLNEFRIGQQGKPKTIDDKFKAELGESLFRRLAREESLDADALLGPNNPNPGLAKKRLNEIKGIVDDVVNKLLQKDTVSKLDDVYKTISGEWMIDPSSRQFKSILQETPALKGEILGDDGRVLASIRPEAPDLMDSGRVRKDVIDEWFRVLDEEADHEDVMAALGEFKPPMRNFLRALAKDDWLGFDHPAQAVNEFLTNPEIYRNFEDLSPGLKSAATKLTNATFRDEMASIKGRSDAELTPLDTHTKGLIETGSTVGKTLDSLAENGSSELIRKMASQLNKAMRDVGDRMVSVKENIKSKNFRGIRGFYDEVKDSITLVKGGDNEETLLHEMIHAATALKIKKNLTGRSLANTKGPYKELYSAFGDARRVLGESPDWEYALTDIDEFVAHAMSDRSFQNALAEIKLKGKRKTLWDTFVQLVSKILGKDVDGTLLEKTLKSGMDIVSEGRGKIKADDIAKRKLYSIRESGDAPDMEGIVDPRAYDGPEPPRGRILNLGQLDSTSKIQGLVSWARQQVEKNYPDPGPKSLAEQNQEAHDVMSTLSPEVANSWKNVGTTVDKAREVRLAAQVLKDIGQSLSHKAWKQNEALKKAKEGEANPDVALAELKNTLQEMIEFEAYYSALGREQALGLGGRRAPYSGRRVDLEPKKIGIGAEEMKNEGLRNQYLRQGGEMNVDKLMKALNEAVDPEDFAASAGRVFKLAKGVQGNKMLAMIKEYWINSILSGPRTQVVNAIGNSITTITGAFETTVGGVLTGNMTVAKHALANLFEWQSVKEAFGLGVRALKRNENFLDSDARAFTEDATMRDAINAENVRRMRGIGALAGEEGSKRSATIDGLGTFFRLPTRLLMSTDEFFKQLNYRKGVRLRAAVEAIETHGMKDAYDIARFVEERLDSVVTESGRHLSEESILRDAMQKAKDEGLEGLEKEEFVAKYKEENWNEEASGLEVYAQEALDEAKYKTFTNDLGKYGQALQKFVQTVPGLSFIMPFIRTPTNILKYAFERTGGTALDFGRALVLKDTRSQILEDINSGDSLRKSKAVGKLTTSAVMAGTMLELATDNKENITGGGPADPKQKKVLEATGWKPYSIKIGDQWLSYQRVDPLGTMLGVTVDLVDHVANAPDDVTTGKLEEVAAGLQLTFYRNVTNKSYLAGVQMLADAFSAEPGKRERLLRNFTAAMVPYSGFLTQSQFGTGDQAAREVRSIMDAVSYKTPGLRGSLDPKRNLLGESTIIEGVPFFSAINPIAHSAVKNDPVLTELASLNYAFQQPSSTHNGLIDLLGYQNQKGQTAHDRRLELIGTTRIGGRTVRQALERLIKSRKYQRMSSVSEPGLTSPRVTEINRVLRKYRSKALEQSISEFPELQSYYGQVTRARKQYRQGADFSEVMQLIQQQ